MSITDATLFKLGKKNITDSMAVTAMVTSLYLPFVSFGVLAVLFFAVLFNPRVRQSTFVGRSKWVLFTFMGLSAVMSAVGGNRLGLLCTLGFFAVVTVGLYMMTVMTRDLFLRCVKYIFRLMPVALAVAIVEFGVRCYIYIIQGKDILHETRCGSIFFFNPNYFGTVAAMTALICIYLFISGKEGRGKAVAIGICSVICLLLSQSIFSCLELLVGAVVMLIVAKKWKYLSILAACLLVVAGAMAMFFEYLPRVGDLGSTTNLRLRIWSVSMDAFKASPMVGQGPLTYYHIYKDYIGREGFNVFATQHAHNLLLDTLLSYGIVGTVLMGSYLTAVGVGVGKTLRKSGDRCITGLIVAACVGVLVHGLVDITLFWSQTGMLFLFILAAAGCGEKEQNN